MLARLRKNDDDKGFTLIELLVVILIIGILAAIAIPTFLNQRQKGYKATLKSDLKSVATAQESYATDNNGAYAIGTDAAILTALEAQGYNQSDDVTVVFTGTTASAFVACAKHANLTSPNVKMTYTSTTGAIVEATGAC